MKISRQTFLQLFKQGGRLHLMLLFGLFLITVVITLQSAFYKEVAPRATVAYLLLIASIYTGRWLTQQFLIKNRWISTTLLFCLSVTVLSAIAVVAMAYLFGLRDGSDLSALVVTAPLLIVVSLISGSLVTATRIVIRQQIKEISILQLQAKMELNLLTSKLSPHFLFNTLNNLYGLSRKEHTKVPDLLLKFSGLLSYSLYSADEPSVQLEEELAYILNFAALEKIRMNDQLALAIDFPGPDKLMDTSITPMVLIVFVENAFKYARIARTDQLYISIKLAVAEELITFEISNSTADEPLSGEKVSSGLGISTTIKRLDLLYGKRYQLIYGRKENFFTVNLKIPRNANH
ncbi:sensor histidine kinase [Pedobacter sp. MC2016-24]|uniref:sensor histidine kinase n=1 Tax=Pedobacter sp. MC2016-24 TaxID=2780090 RepID=UPI001881A199|nr:sensor histidine kinase [Pedobacter sp. MC2016-24]MBE9602355.1 sensor histidine kinase [Pedobacter sp. MC2016-24]